MHGPTNVKFAFDYILLIHFPILYNTTGMSHLKVSWLSYCYLKRKQKTVHTVVN